MSVADQAILARSARVSTVATVIHEQHGKPLGLQLLSESDAVVAIGCVARRNQDGQFSVLRFWGRWREVSLKFQTIGSMQREIFTTDQRLVGWWYR